MGHIDASGGGPEGTLVCEQTLWRDVTAKRDRGSVWLDPRLAPRT